METRIDVAKILAKCPSDMELNCVMFENLYFDCIDYSLKNCPFPICCYYVNDNGVRNSVRFSKYGTYLNISDDKCVIFPKGETTWKGFVPPVEFKDGDIVAATIYIGGTWIGIFKQFEASTFEVYCSLTADEKFINTYTGRHILEGTHLATKEEKEKLFKAIKDNGYRWNAEKKCLEKLIEPKFKVGDRIQYKGSHHKIIHIITGLEADRYILDGDSYIKLDDEDNYSLLKFDINSLNPFDKVLVRDSNDKWRIEFFEKFNATNNYPFCCMMNAYRECVPYKGNEHLLDTKDECGNYYKTWK